jgi:2-polyprenyl-6-methoxyphenol hydroxylase-like FAD-dependent oxidoreductase
LSSRHIAVAGCGPAGLAAAILIDRLGHRVHLFERFATPAPVGSGLMMQPTGRAVLAALSLDDRLARLGHAIERIEGRDARSGRLVLGVDMAGVPHALKPLAVHRAALFNVLYDEVAARGIAIATGVEIAALDHASGDRPVLVDAAGRRHGPFDLVVDALGARSPLKPWSCAPVAVRALPYGALWASLAWDPAEFAPHVLAQRYVEASTMIGVLPVGRFAEAGPEQVTFFWSMKRNGYERWRTEGLEAWKEKVVGLWPATAPLLARIDHTDQLALARYDHHTMTNPWGRRVVFIGDAAHSTSPQLGQGANMALLDAQALALAVEGTDDIDSIGPAYARLRRFHVRTYQSLSAVFAPFYQSDSRLLPLARDLGFALLARLPYGNALLARLVSGLIASPLRSLGLGAHASADALAAGRAAR